MYLKRLKLKNYRLFSDIDVSFQRGMNVLVGKNSSGKSTILEAIDFLLSNNNANIPPEEIIPYSMRNNQPVKVRIDGYFEMSDIEKESLCSLLDNAKDREKIMQSHLELVYTKSINKTKTLIRVEPGIQTNGNGITKDVDLMARVYNTFLMKLHMNNVIKIADIEGDDGGQAIRPLNELLQDASHQTSALYQYLRGGFYNTKLSNAEEFIKIKDEMKKAYPDISDMDIEFDPQRGQVQLYFVKPDNNTRMPLKDEGAGIKEFFYLFLTLRNFPDTVILKDEALTHLHKSLLRDFILAIEGLQYQMVTTSHIKELITTLDFGNIIICKKNNNNSTAMNLMQAGDINAVLEELGYPLEDIPEIDVLIQDTPRQGKA
jgi:predicted ATP-dependent endonuclease of OLD family